MSNATDISVTDCHIRSIVNDWDPLVKNCLIDRRPLICMFDVIRWIQDMFQAPQAGLAHQVSSGVFASKNIKMRDCLVLPCQDLASDHMTPKEVRAANEIYKKVHGDSSSVPPEFRDMQEYLRFRKDDPRDKFLYLSADLDRNNALEPHWLAGLWGFLAQGFDLKFKEFNSLETVCSEIEKGAMAGKLMYVLLHVHGNFDRMAPTKRIWQTDDFSKCFSGLASHGKIILFSCNVGKASDRGDPFDNIAQKIASDAKRQVLAPTDLFYSNFAEMSSADADQLLVYHPKHIVLSVLPFYNSNLMQVFEPKYNHCTELEEGKIKDRERRAADAIRDNLLSQSLLHPATPFQAAQEYLRFCKDDPKEKFLFLSAVYDDAGQSSYFFDPKNSASMLSMLSQRFDIGYQLVESEQDICEALRKASKMGSVAGVILQGMREGNGYSNSVPNGIVLSKSNDRTEVFNGSLSQEFESTTSKCFSLIKKSGRIVFSGAFLGRPDPEDVSTSVAQRIADSKERTVVASKCPVFAESVRVTSLDPLELTHPPLGWYARWRDSRTNSCPATEENLFGVFHPKQR